MAFVIPGHRCHKSGREKGHTSFFNLPMFFSLTKTQNDTKYALKTVVTSNLIFFLQNLVHYQSDQNAPPPCSERRMGGASQAQRGLWGSTETSVQNHLFYCIFGFLITLQFPGGLSHLRPTNTAINTPFLRKTLS